MRSSRLLLVSMALGCAVEQTDAERVSQAGLGDNGPIGGVSYDICRSMLNDDCLAHLRERLPVTFPQKSCQRLMGGTIARLEVETPQLLGRRETNDPLAQHPPERFTIEAHLDPYRVGLISSARYYWNGESVGYLDWVLTNDRLFTPLEHIADTQRGAYAAAILSSPRVVIPMVEQALKCAEKAQMTFRDYSGYDVLPIVKGGDIACGLCYAGSAALIGGIGAASVYFPGARALARGLSSARALGYASAGGGAGAAVDWPLGNSLWDFCKIKCSEYGCLDAWDVCELINGNRGRWLGITTKSCVSDFEKCMCKIGSPQVSSETCRMHCPSGVANCPGGVPN